MPMVPLKFLSASSLRSVCVTIGIAFLAIAASIFWRHGFKMEAWQLPAGLATVGMVSIGLSLFASPRHAQTFLGAMLALAALAGLLKQFI
jgi:hypothetical protein